MSLDGFDNYLLYMSFFNNIGQVLGKGFVELMVFKRSQI